MQVILYSSEILFWLENFSKKNKNFFQAAEIINSLLPTRLRLYCLVNIASASHHLKFIFTIHLQMSQ